MVEVLFLGPISRKSVFLEASNLKEVKEFLKKDKNLEDWLDLCAVCVNENLVSDVNFSLKNGDKIALLPPVCGG